MKKKITLKGLQKMARENPLQTAMIAVGAIIILFVIVAALEMGPELERNNPANPNAAQLGADGNLIWLGMEVGDITRDIRTEFKIPKKVKGVFVINEGLQEAKKFGVLAGDIITSVNRKDVPNKKTFVKAAMDVKYYDGIMMEIYRDNKDLIITIPFEYQYGPLLGPNKGHWQLGSPSVGKALPYGRLLNRQ